MRGKGEQKWRVGWESANKKTSANKINHMTKANHKLEKQLLNLHAIFVRLYPALDILVLQS